LGSWGFYFTLGANNVRGTVHKQCHEGNRFFLHPLIFSSPHPLTLTPGTAHHHLDPPPRRHTRSTIQSARRAAHGGQIE